MFKKNFTNKLVLIEVLTITLPLIWFFISGIQDKNLSPEFLVNIIFTVLLFILFIFRNGSIRHMYFSFVFILLSAIANAFSWGDFVFISSSLAIGLLFLGVLNFFISKEN